MIVIGYLYFSAAMFVILASYIVIDTLEKRRLYRRLEALEQVHGDQ